MIITITKSALGMKKYSNYIYRFIWYTYLWINCISLRVLDLGVQEVNYRSGARIIIVTGEIK